MSKLRKSPFPASRTRRSADHARRRRSLALEGLEPRIVLTQLQYGLFDTGVDAAGAALASGSADTHYTMPVTQQGVAGQSPVVPTSLPASWVGNTSSSRWVGPSGDEAESADPAGAYVYRTTLTAPGAGAARLTGFLAVDDSITDVRINGASTGSTLADAAGSLHAFGLNINLVAGTNTIDFVVANAAAGSTGLQANNLAINFLPTLTVQSNNVVASSGSSVVNSGTFGDLDNTDTVTITSDRGTVTQSGTNSGTYSFFEPNVTTGGTVTITATDSRGGVSTQTFTITSTANQPPVLTSGGGGPVTSRSGGAGVVIDPNVSVSDPDGPNLTTASVSIGSANFVPSEDRLLFTNQNGITGSYNTTTGILSLTGSASAADYQAALRSVRYQNLNAGAASTTPRTISFSIAPGAFSQATGHFYEFISAQGISWTAAKAAADARDIYGLKGYLATITSAAENAFAFSKAQAVGWIGASDAAVEGEWRWADGPENGQQFWQGLSTGSRVNGLYNNWASGEPNNSGNEDYAHFLGNGQWNDYANTTPVTGYLVEYGGSTGDPSLQLTSVTTVNVVNVTDTPTVSSPTVAGFTSGATATIAGTAPAGSLLRIYADANANGLLDEGEAVVGSQQLAAGQSAYEVAVALTPNSANHFAVTALAGSAAESSPIVVPTITADSIAPVLPVVTGPAAPLALNAAVATITGTAEAGSLVLVYTDANNNGVVDEGDTLVGSEQLAAASSAYSIDAPLAPDAANRFLVTAVDAAGNESAPAAVPTITADSIAPAFPVVATPSVVLAVNSPAYTITGTAEAGSLVVVYADANANGLLDEGEAVVGSQQLAAGEASFRIAVPLVPDAPNRFLVTATDAAGNRSAPAVAPTIIQDSTLPALPTVTGPVGPLALNAAVATITGTAEAGSLVRVYADANNNGVVDEGEEVVGSQQLGPDQADYGITALLVANSANHLVVTATDAGGNETAPVVVPTITADSAAPMAPRLTSPLVPTAVAAAGAIITGTAEAGSLVRVYADANNNGVVDEGDLLVASQPLAADATDFSILAPLAPDAANRFLVTATDAAGNPSAALAVPTITQDSAPPAVPTLGTASAAAATNATSVTLTGSAEAGSFVRVYADANGNGAIDEGEEVVGTQQLGPDQTTYSITVPLARDAANRFLVTTTDLAGNQSAPAVLPTIIQDSTPPAAPAVATLTAPATTAAPSVTVTGTAEAGSFVLVYADANGNGVVDAGEVVLGSLQLAPGRTDFSILVPLAGNAANRLLVTATDAAGNPSAALAVPTIIQDSAPPAAPAGGLTLTSPTTVTSGSFTLSGTAEAGSLVLVYADANGNGILDGDELVVGSVQLAPGQTTYSITVPLARDSANRFLVTATDAAGNPSPVLVVPTITQSSTVSGTAYLDRNANGVLDAGEPVLAGRVLYLDLNGSGTRDDGEPTSTSDDAGHFSFPGYAAGAGVVREDTAQVPSRRYAVSLPATTADGQFSGVVPFSPIFPIPVLPSPFVGNAGSADDGYVRSLYRAVLGREGSDAEVAGWMAGMQGGMSAERVAAGFNNSVEHRTAQVAAFYDAFLHRGVDPGARYWVDRLLAGGSEQEVVRGILNSPEYLAAHADSELMVRDLYLDVLGREGSEAEVAAYRAALASGLDVGAMIDDFVASPEANDQIVESLYTAGLNREREPGTSAIWTSRLAADASAGDVAVGILSSPEFRLKATPATRSIVVSPPVT